MVSILCLLYNPITRYNHFKATIHQLARSEGTNLIVRIHLGVAYNLNPFLEPEPTFS